MMLLSIRVFMHTITTFYILISPPPRPGFRLRCHEIDLVEKLGIQMWGVMLHIQGQRSSSSSSSSRHW